MLTKITKIYLYTDDSEASQMAKAWCAEQGLVVGKSEDYQINYYGPGSEEQHQLVFDALNGWTWANGPHEFSSFPFLHYSEIHSDVQPGDPLPLVAFLGLDDILESNVIELYKLDRS